MSDLEQVQEKDQQEHPNCSYSQSRSKTCHMVDGQLQCKTMIQLFRNCPCKRPVEIYRKEENSTNDQIMNNQEVDEFEKSLQDMGKMFEYSFGMRMPPLYPHEGIDRGYDQPFSNPYSYDENDSSIPVVPRMDEEPRGNPPQNNRRRGWRRYNKSDEYYDKYNDISSNI